MARYPWLKPIAYQAVGGAFDPKKLGFPWKFIPAMRKVPVSDARKWTTIRRVGERPCTLLHGEPAVSGARD